MTTEGEKDQAKTTNKKNDEATPRPPMPPRTLQKPCGLTRDEMACIETALAVIVVKKRLQGKQQSSKKHQANKRQKKKSQGNPIASLKNVTGEGLFAHRSAAAAEGATLQRESSMITPTNLLSLSHRGGGGSSSAGSIVHPVQLPLALNNNNEKLGWAAHLQHVLKLAVSSINNNNRSSNSSNTTGLAVHAACQIEQAAASNNDDGGVIADWIKQQMIEVPASATMNIETTNEAAALSWLQIWRSMVQVKPIVLAELLVPVLLDLLLLKPHQQAPSAMKISDTTAPTNHHAKLEPVHWLILLEDTLEKAPQHVLENVSQVFQGGNNKFLPCNNSAWYSTQDLAYDYSTADSSEQFLLVHGLAEISEQLMSLDAAMAVDHYYGNNGSSDGIGTFAASLTQE